MHAGGPAWHTTRPLPFLSTSASPNLAHQQQHAGSRFSRPQQHFDLALRHWGNVVWDGLPTTAVARCAWVDEVLRDSVEWWTFTQFCKFSFNTDASDAMALACQRSASLTRVINKRLLRQWRHYSIGLGPVDGRVLWRHNGNDNGNRFPTNDYRFWYTTVLTTLIIINYLCQLIELKTI